MQQLPTIDILISAFDKHLEVGILCFSQSLEKLGKSPKTGRFQDSFQIARGHIPILKYRRR